MLRVILIGGGKTVYYLARQFVNRHYYVTIINKDPIQSRELAQQTKATVVLGDGTDLSRLEEAGARQADVLLALTPYDQDNLIACQIAQRKFGLPRTIALANDPDNEAVFQQLGVTTVYSDTRLIGAVLDQETNFEAVEGFVQLAHGKVNVTDVRLNEDSPVVGRLVQDLKLAEDSLIACIIRDDQTIVPRGNTQLLLNDHLVLISASENQFVNLELICGDV
jgi:trk system potassium uptake protein